MVDRPWLVRYMPYTARPTRPELLALVGILALAAFLRLALPGVVEFRQDEANLSQIALDMARGRAFPLSSIDSSVGILQPPGSIYLLVPPFLFSSDPRLATQYIGLLNVLAVLCVYLIVRRSYGPPGALVAALLYAVNPWAVIYSRKIWLADLIPVLAALCLLTGIRAFVEGRRWAQLAHLPVLALAGLIHFLNFVMIFPTLYLLWIGKRRLSRAFWLSIPIALLVFSPFLLGPSARDMVSALQSGGRIFRNTQAPRPFSLSGEAFEMSARMISSADIALWAGEAQPGFLSQLPLSGTIPIFNLLPILTAFAALWLIIHSLRWPDARTPVDIALLIWLLATPLVFSITWTPQIYSQYFVTMHGAAFAVMGAAFAELWRARRAVAIPTLAGLIVVAGLQAWVIAGLLSFVGSHATAGGFSTPLGDYVPIREAVLSRRPAQVLARLDGQYIGYNEQASIWNMLLYDVPVVRFLQDGIEVYPAQPALVLTADCEPSDLTFYTRRYLDSAAPESCYRLSEQAAGGFPASDFTSLPAELAALRFSNGADLTAYRWQPEMGCLSLAWSAEGPARGPANDFFQVALHYIDAQGAKLFDADGYFWNGRYWRAGDVIVRQLCSGEVTARRAEIAGVQVGLYTIEDVSTGPIFHGIDVLDTNGSPGSPVGQHIEIRLN